VQFTIEQQSSNGIWVQIATRITKPEAEELKRKYELDRPGYRFRIVTEEPDAWHTVIDQNGNQRGQFLSAAKAQEYLDSAPPFIDRARSRIKRLEG
jgi:hypothetical protein